MPELTGMSDKAARELSKTLLFRMESVGGDQLEATERVGMHNIRGTLHLDSVNEQIKINIFWRDIDEGIGSSITSYSRIIDGKVNIVRDTYYVNVIRSNGSQWSPDRLLTPEEVESFVVDKYISNEKVSIRRALQVIRFLELDLKEQFESQSLYEVVKPTKLPEKTLVKLTKQLVEKMTEGGSLQPSVRQSLGSFSGTDIDSFKVVSKFITDEGREKLSINMTLIMPLQQVSIEGRYLIQNGIPKVVPFYYWVVLSRAGRDIVVKPTTTVGVNGAVCKNNQKEFTKPIQECLELLQSVEVELRKQFES